MKRSHINFDIEMLRGIAIIMVLFQHYPSLYFWSDHKTFNWLSQYLAFWSGVDLFFCISGFVVGKTVIKRLDDSLTGNGSIKIVIFEFFVKRAFRLLPTSILWVMLLIVLSKLFNISGAFGIYEENIKQAISILTYNYNWYVKSVNEAGIPATFAPYWSLNLEEQFYFALPLFLFLFRNKFRIPALLMIIAILFFIKRQGHLSFNFRIDAISYGVILSIISSRPAYHKVKNFLMSQAYSPVSSLIILITLLIFIPGVMRQSNFMVGTLAFVSCIIVYLASFNQKLVTLPQKIRKIFIYIGTRSYGLYLIHMPAIYITQETFARYFAFKGVMPHGGALICIVITFVSLVVTAALVELNFIFVEAPTRNFGSKLAKLINSKPQLSETKAT